jgi:hypothetical protein
VCLKIWPAIRRLNLILNSLIACQQVRHMELKQTPVWIIKSIKTFYEIPLQSNSWQNNHINSVKIKNRAEKTFKPVRISRLACMDLEMWHTAILQGRRDKGQCLVIQSYLMSSRRITAALSCRLSSGTLNTMQSPKLVRHTKQLSECWPPAVVNCTIPVRRTRAPSWAVSLNLQKGFRLGSVKIWMQK